MTFEIAWRLASIGWHLIGVDSRFIGVDLRLVGVWFALHSGVAPGTQANQFRCA
jgi:hypothetical protein